MTGLTAATLGNTIAEERGMMGLIRFSATQNFEPTTIQITNAQLRRNTQFETYDTPTVLELNTAPCPDINGDGRVGFADFLPFAETFGTSRGSERYNARYDFDADGSIGFGDFLILSQFYGTEVDCTHPQAASKTVAITGTNSEAQIQLISSPGSQSDQIMVDVQVQNADQVKGYHLDLSYNPETLELINIQGRNGSAFGTPIIHTAPGSATLADILASNAQINEQGELATLTFRVLSPTYTLDLTEGVLADNDGHINILRDIQLQARKTVSLEQNVPNPFNPATQIAYTLPQAGDVLLVIHNLLGQEIRVLDRGYRTAGRYQISWDGKDALGHPVSSGVYIYRLTGANQIQTRRMMLLK
ncbi:MAG: cohesin domain-containing protein [Candidatus Latescibacteria bacterium]|jgi:hypothetical protein|nr:cohesin domain-containing protein [Candidatus Latescibacterota bacterium]